MIKCDVCGYNNADTATFCLQCGAPITRQKVSEAIDDISGEKTLVIGSRSFSGNKPGAAPAPPMGGPMKLPPPTLPKNPAAAPAPAQMAAPAAPPAPAPRPAPVIPDSAPDVPRTSIPPTTTSLPTVPPAAPLPASAAAQAMPKWVIPVIGVLVLLVVVLIAVLILK